MNQVAEGVKAASVIMEFADKYGLNMPIAREVDGVINHGSTVEQAYRGLVAEQARPRGARAQASRAGLSPSSAGLASHPHLRARLAPHRRGSSWRTGWCPRAAPPADWCPARSCPAGLSTKPVWSWA